jgi:hypothetical protein
MPSTSNEVVAGWAKVRKQRKEKVRKKKYGFLINMVIVLKVFSLL